MRQYSVAEVRSGLAQVIDACSDAPVEITRHGKSVAVLIEPELFERLMAAAEDLEDAQAFDEVVSSTTAHIPWERVKRDLGLA